MSSAAKAAGAEIRTDAEVAEIRVKDGAAISVVLKSGDEIPAKAIISNADPKRTLLKLVDPTHLGGTRHLSAAQFVHDQRDAVALVASQDGRFTVFAWSPCESMVHAHRVEALLL